MKCEGLCSLHGGCRGETRTVYVAQAEIGGWAFNYCDEAIARDRANGFVVREYWPRGEDEEAAV